jgi:hypothetical protein
MKAGILRPMQRRKVPNCRNARKNLHELTELQTQITDCKKRLFSLSTALELKEFEKRELARKIGLSDLRSISEK